VTHQDDRAIGDALDTAGREGRPCALATVVATRGSTPRKVGARLVVDPQLGLTGTVGGGCGEAEVIAAAQRVLASGAPERIQVDLTEDILSWSPAVCGGTMDVFIEAVAPDAMSGWDDRPARVRIHYRRPPDRIQIFDHRLVHQEPGVFVTLAESISASPPMRIEGQVALEEGSDVVWFTFEDTWHDVGRFHRADGTFTGIYANILTPVQVRGSEWFTTDLYLDVWIPADGEPVILDEDELDDAVGREQVDMEAADRARHEAQRLLRAALDGEWPPSIVDAWTLERCRSTLGGGPS
jgi:predicted RNA-binding protein associated with RNAse of E/G family